MLSGIVPIPLLLGRNSFVFYLVTLWILSGIYVEWVEAPAFSAVAHVMTWWRGGGGSGSKKKKVGNESELLGK